MSTPILRTRGLWFLNLEGAVLQTFSVTTGVLGELPD